jgi:hypothetical protein
MRSILRQHDNAHPSGNGLILGSITFPTALPYTYRLPPFSILRVSTDTQEQQRTGGGCIERQRVHLSTRIASVSAFPNGIVSNAYPCSAPSTAAGQCSAHSHVVMQVLLNVS